MEENDFSKLSEKERAAARFSYHATQQFKPFHPRGSAESQIIAALEFMAFRLGRIDDTLNALLSAIKEKDQAERKSGA